MLQIATDADLDDISTLVNSAYRGDSSRAGWTTEADYLDGQRTSRESLRDDLKSGEILYWLREGEMIGCVFVSVEGNLGYLGMLTIKPGLQDGGLGRKLLEAAEDHARRKGARAMTLTVVQLRDSLMAWYERRGYRRTGETKPFPYGDERFGSPKRDDLHFIVFEKSL
jgi:ribosomal protein S18 acetylase RimI-like enzyme